MQTDTPLTDKEIIVEQQKTIKVLQSENLRLQTEAYKKKDGKIETSQYGQVKKL